MTGVSLDELPGGHHDDHSGRRRRHPRRRRLRGGTALAFALVMVVGGAIAAYFVLAPLVAGLFEEQDYAGPGSGEVVVQVGAGDSGRAIGTTLAEAGVVKTSRAFVDAARSEPAADSIQPGSYRLREQMSAGDALALLLDPTARVTERLTIPEGLRLADQLTLISDSTGISLEDLKAALAQPEAIGLHPEAAGNAEGFLFPATYDIAPDATAVQVLSQLTARFDDAIAEAEVPAGRVRQTVVLASLIQAEARLPEDFPLVSRVLWNRLAADMPLQLDSTVLYAVGEKSVTTTPEQRAFASPYNTYAVKGVPAGPIDAPGLEAMKAARNPAPGPWLYFVTVNPDTGETRYATTFAEHEANVRLFQAWLAAN